jgi:hypothetical protein
MKDGTLTILYTKETREACSLLCAHRAYRAAEQQSSRALCRSRDTLLCCLGSWSQRTPLHADPAAWGIITHCLQRSATSYHFSIATYVQSLPPVCRNSKGISLAHKSTI